MSEMKSMSGTSGIDGYFEAALKRAIAMIASWDYCGRGLPGWDDDTDIVDKKDKYKLAELVRDVAFYYLLGSPSIEDSVDELREFLGDLHGKHNENPTLEWGLSNFFSVICYFVIFFLVVE